MDRQAFIDNATPLFRHGLTALAGVLVAHGLTAPADALTSFGSAIVLAAAGLSWSLIEKSRLLAALVDGANPSDVELLAGQLVSLRANGASPLLVAHTAQTLATFAVNEIMAMHGASSPGKLPPAPDPPAALPSAPVAGDLVVADTSATEAAPAPAPAAEVPPALAPAAGDPSGALQ